MNLITLASQNNVQPFMALIPWILILGLMWFMMGRSRKRREEQMNKMRQEMKKGVEVVTIGGLHGVIDSIDTLNKTITLDVEGIYLTFEDRAIARVVTPVKPATAPTTSPVAEKKAATKSTAKKTTTKK